jgi:oxygen-independent coproporphyrinogen III oxidase
MTWTYHPDLLATPVPRYTSYPTAAEFSGAVGRADMEQALVGVSADEPVSLYVHIPYCHEICWYCGCNTGAANKTGRLAAYLEALHAEIDTVSRLLAGNGRIQRIAFGGGSPNAVDPEQFAELLAHLRDRFAADGAMLSIELDPRSLSGPWFDAIGAAGITRASLGVQTLEPAVQAEIGRVQPRDLIRVATDALRRAGIRSLNFDLMYGLPGQGLAELENTLREAAEMRPERIALFGYAHVPHLIPRQRRIDDSALPNSELRFRQAELGHRMLTHANYDPLGFDHYAVAHDPLSLAARREGLRRNFQGFTDDAAEVMIGLGASAISQFPGLIVQNDKNAGRYRIKATSGLLTAEGGVVRTAEDRRRGRVIERLLCDGEAQIAGIVDPGLRDRLTPFLERGLATIECGKLRLPDYGRPYARVVASLFDTYRQPAARRFSSAI